MDVGFTLFGIPFRLGEVAFFLSFFRLLDIKYISKVKRVHVIGILILGLLITNLSLVLITKMFSVVDQNFYYKYIFRNFLYIIVLFSFVLRPLNYGAIEYERYIRYILYLTLIFYGIELVDYYVINFNWSEAVFVSRQGKTIFSDFIIRFAGQSSEPAYIIPLLSIPLMYGYHTRKIKYSAISIVLMLLPFSSFGYVVILMSILYIFFVIRDVQIKRKVRLFLVYSLSGGVLVALIFAKKLETIILYNWSKFQAYFGVKGVNEWSADQRSGHIDLATTLYDTSSWWQKIIGSGTGYYSLMRKNFILYYLDDAEEAHNLYISSLTDRGVLGVIVVGLLFYAIVKIKIPKEINGAAKSFFMAIRFGILVRIFHWFFTGMLWQYYFWVEVIIILSASTYYMRISHEKR